MLLESQQPPRQPCCTKVHFYSLLHQVLPHKLVIYMVMTPMLSQTGQALVVESYLTGISEFTSHQFSNNSHPTCYSRSPLFPKLPPQLIKMLLLGLGYLKLLDQVTKTYSDSTSSLTFLPTSRSCSRLHDTHSTLTVMTSQYKKVCVFSFVV